MLVSDDWIQVRTMAQIAAEAEEHDRRVVAGDVQWGGWSFDPSIFTLDHRAKGYQVDLLQIGCAKDLAFWIGHIADKHGLFGAADVGYFVRALADLGRSENERGTFPLFRILPEDEILHPLPSPLDAEACRASGVYAIRAGGALKIGRACDIGARRASLQTGNPAPLEVLAVLSKNQDHERVWHAKFEHLRIDRGEWFRFGEQIAVHIRDARATWSL